MPAEPDAASAWPGVGGEMHRLLSDHDWSASALGPTAAWPQSLKTAVEIALGVHQPAAVLWGADFVCLYNDAFARALGPQHHPASFGRPARTAWPAAFALLEAELLKVLAGGVAMRHADRPLPLFDDGRRWSWSQGPIHDPGAPGGVGGVLLLASAAAPRSDNAWLQRALETEVVGILLFDRDGVLIDANSVFLRMTGYTRADVEQRALDWRRLTPPEWTKDSEAQMAKLAETGRIGPYEKQYLRKDGSRAWMLFTGRELGDGTIVEYAVDIDDRKRAEAALRVNEEALRAITDSIPVMIGYVDREQRYVWVNAGFERYFGVPSSAIVGKTVREWLGEDGYRRLADGIALVLRGERVTFEDMIPDKHGPGRHGWTEENYIPRIAPTGEVEGFYVLALDITARKRAEAALRESEQRFRTLAESIEDVFYMTDLEHNRLDYVSPSYERVWGWPEAELRADLSSFLKTIHPDDLPAFQTGKAAQARGEPVVREYRIVRPNGEVRWILDRSFPVPGREGKLSAGVAFDITPSKLAEEQVRLLVREVAHRSKNMLSVVQSIARNTARGQDPAAFAERLNERIAALAHGHELLVRNDWRGADLAEVVHTQLQPFRDLVGTRVSIEGPPLRVKPAAAQAIGMALHELATNAAKYGALAGTSGNVAVDWRLDGATFHMAWRERGGPAVRAPERMGFGGTVMVRAVESALSGEVDLAFEPTGLEWQVAAPADRMLDRG